MTIVLLLFAVAGMIVGVYAVAMPTLTRKGWRLPFAGFFSDADEEDEPFTPAFEMPRVSDAPVTLDIATLDPAMVEETALPPVLRPADVDEDDPTLTPLFEELVAEIEAPPADVPDAATAEQQTPAVVVVHSQPAAVVQTPENAVPEPVAEEPQQPEGEVSDSDNMLALFAESADAGKGPNIIHEAVGDVAITDLMDEVRKLREILDKRAA